VQQDAKLSTYLGDKPGNLITIALISLVAGAATGLVGSAFRLALVEADHFREALVAWAHHEGVSGFLVVIAAAAVATAAAAWLVRRFSHWAKGSGIPHVEAVLNQESAAAPILMVPIKFLGGTLAIGAGLALGREGPIVQMGAGIAHHLGRLWRRSLTDCRVLMAAGAGAGLATAFNAPISGAAFVLEELVRRFETRIAIAALGASAGAIAVARLFLGSAPDFHIAQLPYPGFGTVPIHLILGLIAGFLGVAYNRAILGALSFANGLRRCPVELRAGLIGALVGLLAWIGPGLVGGGEAIAQQLFNRTEEYSAVLLVFLVRFGLGPVSYAAGAPGGLFAPMLLLGAQIGILFGIFFGHWLPGLNVDPTSLAIVGMAAFFTTVVRAPLTGIILIIEMTGSFTLLLPMLSACFTAMLVPTLLTDPPIYWSLGASFRQVDKQS
jgi:CIC family chloride channel protein